MKNLSTFSYVHKLFAVIAFAMISYIFVNNTEVFSYFPSDIDATNTCPTFPIDVSSEMELFEALGCFNSASAGRYDINLLADISLTSGTPTIDNSQAAHLIINGNNKFIDGSDLFRVLTIETGHVTLNELTLQRGRGANDGAGLYIGASSFVTITESTIMDNIVTDDGGGIYNRGTLTISRSEVTESTIMDNIVTYDGGGIYNRGTLTISRSEVMGNSAKWGGGILNLGVLDISDSIVSENRSLAGGHLSARGGGIANSGQMVIHNSTISGNSAFAEEGVVNGGGIANFGQVTIHNSTISNNSATSRELAGSFGGGGVENSGTMTITSSTISDNTTTNSGGGVFNLSSFLILNSTISGNSADSYGGGVFSGCFREARIIHSTVTANSAGSGGGLATNCGTFVVRNSIVADNSFVVPNSLGADCNIWGGDMNATNLDSDGSCAEAMQSDNINLGPLQDNGGATYTHALLPGSDAIDAIGGPDCILAPVSGVDQRGGVRPKGPLCDIGAYEAEQSETICPGFPANVATEDELNTAITCINSVQSGIVEINLTASINLSKPMVAINNLWGVALQIDGQSHAIDGDNQFRTLYIAQGAVTMTNLILQNGRAEEHGGALFIASGSRVTLEDSQIINSAAMYRGGGIYNLGDMTMIRTLVSNNDSYWGGFCGGGLFNGVSASTTIVSSVLSENSASCGAGIDNKGELIIQESALLKNHVRGQSHSSGGGALRNSTNNQGDQSSVDIINATISGNSASLGGGLLIHHGEINITNSTIFNNVTYRDDSASIENYDQLTLRNTIVINPFGEQVCKNDDVFGGLIVANSSNLNDDGSCGDATQSSDIHLGRLQNNGGFAPTHSLLPESVAIDAGDAAVCNDVSVNGVDQRGMARSQGVSCDVGAFEKGVDEDTSGHETAIQSRYMSLIIR